MTILIDGMVMCQSSLLAALPMQGLVFYGRNLGMHCPQMHA